MEVRIVKVLDHENVIVEINHNIFKTKWSGKYPEKNTLYDIELDIDDVFSFSENMRYSDERASYIKCDGNQYILTGILNFDHTSNLASICVFDNIVLINIYNENNDISNKWVEIKFDSMIITDINL